MPMDVQLDALHKIPALRDAKIYRPGYAIEYDYFDPTQLKPSLESKLVGGLFFAGQVNGTTGYEEAGGQGTVAGINAALLCSGGDPLVMKRDESYIGVLIDDLTTKGVDEPYRMFTSRDRHLAAERQRKDCGSHSASAGDASASRRHCAFSEGTGHDVAEPHRRDCGGNGDRNKI